MNQYAQRLAELQSHADHELKEVGDQWQTPKAIAFGLFWHFAPKIGPVVLDLFANDGNQLAANYYTAEINAMTQDWAGDLKQFGGAAFANPPYSRPYLDEDGTPITGIDHVLQYCREQREQGAKIMLLLKAATSDGWWPEDADFIQFISGRIGFQTPDWYVPRDPKKDKPSSSGFASAVIIFDKEWQWERRPTERLSRHLLETQGRIIIDMVESRASVIAAEINNQFISCVMEAPTAKPVIDDVVDVESEPKSDIEDDNYHLDLVDEEPKEDFSDKTIDLIWVMDEKSSPLLRIIMLTLLFGKKSEYTHREIQFAFTSLLTEGETTNAQSQYADALAIELAMKEFISKHQTTLQQQHDFIYAMFILCLSPSKTPLYKNVKTLIKINDIYSKVRDIDAVIDKIEAEESVTEDHLPALTAVLLKEKYMKLEDFSDLSEDLQKEAIEKTIDAAKSIDDEFKDHAGAAKSIDVIEKFFALTPTVHVFLNIRQLRAAFRDLIKTSIKEAALCPEA